MKTAIAKIPVELKNEQREISGKFKEPGIVRGLSFMLRPRPVVSLISKGKPEYDELPLIFMECDPDAETRQRRFVFLPTDTVYEPKPGIEARWCATAVSVNTGAVMHLFELVEAPS